MALQIYATVVGAKQGAFKGESTAQNAKGKIPGVGLTYGVESPRDPASGLATGKRHHEPVVFVKEWGASSPQFYTALSNNESLTSALFEFFSSDAQGRVTVSHTIKLTNAIVSSVEQSVHLGDASVDPRELHVISFVFQKIEITDAAGGTTFVDDWEQVV